MSRINSRAKGASGEREFCNWISENLDIHHGERNLEQVRSGGADITNCYPFMFEVKRVENLDLQSAWIQVKTAVVEMQLDNNDPNLIPVVCFRYNRHPWEFLIPASLIGNEKGYLRLNEKTFTEFALKELDMYAAKLVTSMAAITNIEDYRS
jgi:hypothetical protein